MTSDYGKRAIPPTESETTRTVGNFSHGSRETPATSAAPMAADRSEKAHGHKSDMHVAGESDSSIVPEKPANNGSLPLPAESAEGRGLTEENTEQLLRVRTGAPQRGRLAVRTPVARVVGCTCSGTQG